MTALPEEKICPDNFPNIFICPCISLYLVQRLGLDLEGWIAGWDNISVACSKRGSQIPNATGCSQAATVETSINLQSKVENILIVSYVPSGRA